MAFFASSNQSRLLAVRKVTSVDLGLLAGDNCVFICNHKPLELMMREEKEEQNETFACAGKSGEETAMLPGAQALTVRLARLVSSIFYQFFCSNSTLSDTREAL